MKLHTFLLCFVLSNTGLCSWPDKATTAAAISADPSASFSQYLKEADEIYATAENYRSLTLKFNHETLQWDCSVPIAYYEVTPWLSDAWEDSDRVGWSRRPGNGLENVHSDVASLIGILDESKIEVRRVSIVRMVRETKEVRAIWNKLEFSIPRDKIATIYPFMKELYGDYRPDMEVTLYITKREANKAEMATPRKPSD